RAAGSSHHGLVRAYKCLDSAMGDAIRCRTRALYVKRGIARAGLDGIAPAVRTTRNDLHIRNERLSDRSAGRRIRTGACGDMVGLYRVGDALHIGPTRMEL